MLYNIILTSIIINLIFAIMLTIGKFYVFKQNNKTMIVSYFSLIVIFILAFYLFSLMASIISLFIFEYILFGVFLLIFLLNPFIIGYFASYDKLRLYINLQTIVLLINLCISIYISDNI